MNIILFRKPLSEKSIVENVKKHGTGALNIDDTRIKGPSWKWGTQTDIKGGGFASKRPSEGDVFAKNVESDPKGRWTANLILRHLNDCRKVGCKKVGSGDVVLNNKDSSHNAHGGYQRSNTSMFTHNIKGNIRSFGEEVVEDWQCIEGCPVLELGKQSGHSKSVGGVSSGKTSLWDKKGESKILSIIRHQDKGTATRFFKQVSYE